MDKIYIVGHVNPDTDSIAAAMGYAWLLRERDGLDTIAARASAINPQTAWVLKRLELEPPILLNDASPRFATITRHLDTSCVDAPLQDAWAIATSTWGVAPVINPDNTPFGMITGASLFSFLTRITGSHPKRQEMRITEFLDLPCREACNTRVPGFQVQGRIRDSIKRILREEGDDFFVIDEKNQYVGVCRQRDVLNPPRLKIILVDHNEPRQALSNLEEAELIEILDHHRLGNPSTHVPIRFNVDIVGSTSTLIAEQVKESGLKIPSPLASMLIAGLLSDTLNLVSPTTTERDKTAAKWLAGWAFAEGETLSGETIHSFGEQVLHAGTGLSSRGADEIVNTDLKLYEAGGFRFIIAQAEVTDLVQLDKHLEQLKTALEALRERKSLDFAVLMITDVVGGSSRLLITNEPPELSDLPYSIMADGTRLAEGIVSRKKQLLPVVLGLLER